jgi:hypothetical protein
MREIFKLRRISILMKKIPYFSQTLLQRLWVICYQNLQLRLDGIGRNTWIGSFISQEVLYLFLLTWCKSSKTKDVTILQTSTAPFNFFNLLYSYCTVLYCTRISALPATNLRNATGTYRARAHAHSARIDANTNENRHKMRRRKAARDVTTLQTSRALNLFTLP